MYTVAADSALRNFKEGTMELDKHYISMYQFKQEFDAEVRNSQGQQEIAIGISPVEDMSEVAVKSFKILPPDRLSENMRFVERVVKTMLWAYGGVKIYVKCDDRQIASELAKIYSRKGARRFDVEFMEDVYQLPFEVKSFKGRRFATKRKPIKAKKNIKGRRIGFDAGGSDRKVTALIDGKVVFEKETVWHPKTHEDPAYHKAGILESMNMALEALGGKVDAIGVSTAGIVVDDEIRVSSLFIKVPKEMRKDHVHGIYKDLEKRFDAPVKVANDGDVAALAGARAINKGKVLGIAMGTSEAAGYIDKDMHITGYLNELAFAPVDANISAMQDEWSLDIGVGCKYHSQDAVIKLANEANVKLDPKLTLAEKLKEVQKLANEYKPNALGIFRKMGQYLGYSILWYNEFYDIETVVLYGRVLSGVGGETLLEVARETLSENGSKIEIVLPDEMTRRLGQSYAAALM